MPSFDSEAAARWESRLRPFLVRLPPRLAVRLYSAGRRRFLSSLSRELPAPIEPAAALARRLWGLDFRSPLGNAAGMFKTGDGYPLSAAQGAGFYLAGTTTGRPREGNRRHGVFQPFAPYPRSGAASNWLGLPNPGHREVAAKLAELRRFAGCPVGASVAACPDPALAEEEKLEQLAAGMRLYEEAGVDFLEMNESCPNTADGASSFEDLRARLRFVAERFLARRARLLPVVVKVSCDTDAAQVAPLVELLAALGFDGVNFGNTSTAYADHREAIAPAERRLFDHFTRRFGGGLSGRPLAAASLHLCQLAARHLARHSPGREFHVVRTGGIMTAADLRASEQAGVGLCQWYTGYFESFAGHGHAVYRQLYRQL